MNSIAWFLTALVVGGLLWVVYVLLRFLKGQYYAWVLNRRQRRAYKALAKRGGRTWPL